MVFFFSPEASVARKSYSTEETVQIISRLIKSSEALYVAFIFLLDTENVTSQDDKSLSQISCMHWGAWEEQKLWNPHSFLIILITVIILHLGLCCWLCLPLLWQLCLMKTSLFSMRHCFSKVLMKSKFCNVLYVKEDYDSNLFLHHYQCTFLWFCL